MSAQICAQSISALIRLVADMLGHFTPFKSIRITDFDLNFQCPLKNVKLWSYNSSKLCNTLKDQLRNSKGNLWLLTNLKEREKQKSLLHLLYYLSEIKTKILMFLNEIKCLPETRSSLFDKLWQLWQLWQISLPEFITKRLRDYFIHSIVLTVVQIHKSGDFTAIFSLQQYSQHLA